MVTLFVLILTIIASFIQRVTGFGFGCYYGREPFSSLNEHSS